MEPISAEVLASMRWQNSPLTRALELVVGYSKAHEGKRVGDNQATRMVVFAASELRDLHEKIMAGELDGLGYEL